MTAADATAEGADTPSGHDCAGWDSCPNPAHRPRLTEGADTVAAEVAAVLGDNPELAAHIRDARSNEDPCPHWVGQSLAVCAPCLRDRLAPHVGRLVAARLHARHAAALDEARAENAQLREWLREVTAEWREQCRFDHNGDCQAHGYFDGPCSIPLIRHALDTTPPTPETS